MSILEVKNLTHTYDGNTPFFSDICLPFSWVVWKDVALPCSAVDVSIDLSSDNALVTKHVLNDAKICTVLYKMSGERVPERVRRNLFSDICNQSLFLDHLEH